jgi:hypothetical protein
MAKLLTLTPNKTYATEANAIKAVEKRFPGTANDGLRYILQRTHDGRFYPVFIGNSAIHAGVHFHFHVVN